MAVEIDSLHVVVRVTTAPRAHLQDPEQRAERPRAGQRVHLMPPPKPQAAAAEASIPLQAESEPEQMAWAAAAVDPTALAERVYEMMRYDLRVARERSGSAT